MGLRPSTVGNAVGGASEFSRAANRFYSVARRCTTARLVVLLGFALAPAIVIPEGDAALVLPVIAAIWAGVEAIVLRPIERYYVRRGALAQEMHDREVFGLPWSDLMTTRLTNNEIAGTAHKIGPCPPVYSEVPTTPDGIQQCQAENAVYSVRTLRIAFGLVVAAMLVVFAFGVYSGKDLVLADYLRSVLVPSLPPLLALLAIADRQYQALQEWKGIEGAAVAVSSSLDRTRAIQGAIYSARSRFPLAPRVAFRLARKGLG